ncbi:MAG TPA: class I SAM-dependent methyltransferase [Solirubrobacterales bacterium]
MERSGSGDGARETYDSFAASYDDFNHRYMYERWTGRLLEKAEEAGLQGNRLLDIGCGTGLSFLALLERGWQVTACDISPEMVERAREKVGDRAELLTADMRDLPDLGQFDLVWAVNDAINYLLSGEDLVASLTGMRRSLAPGGVVLFDVNTLISYRTFFSEEIVVEREGRTLIWQGQGSGDEVAPGSISEARFEAAEEAGTEHVHQQRHFPEAQVRAALAAAGLECAALYGELEGNLDPELDEDRHSKAVYVARAA